jgi:hypothetical protein
MRGEYFNILEEKEAKTNISSFKGRNRIISVIRDNKTFSRSGLKPGNVKSDHFQKNGSRSLHSQRLPIRQQAVQRPNPFSAPIPGNREKNREFRPTFAETIALDPPKRPSGAILTSSARMDCKMEEGIQLA